MESAVYHPKTEPRKITAKLRDYYVTFDDDQRGRKITGASAEHAARIFLGSTEREDNTRCVLVGTQEMWRKNEHYIYYLQGIPSPARRIFECYVTEIIDGDVFYIFQCSQCQYERIYGNASFCARPETTIAFLLCKRCCHRRAAVKQKPKYTLHRFVEIASPAMAKRISAAPISTAFSKSLESGRMAEAFVKAADSQKATP